VFIRGLRNARLREQSPPRLEFTEHVYDSRTRAPPGVQPPPTHAAHLPRWRVSLLALRARVFRLPSAVTRRLRASEFRHGGTRGGSARGADGALEGGGDTQASANREAHGSRLLIIIVIGGGGGYGDRDGRRTGWSSRHETLRNANRDSDSSSSLSRVGGARGWSQRSAG